MKNKKANEKKDKIKDLLKVEEDSGNQINSRSSTENSILEKIRK